MPVQILTLKRKSAKAKSAYEETPIDGSAFRGK
jgi:hypothetical protein